MRVMRLPPLACLILVGLTAVAQAQVDPRVVLQGLIGHSEADVIKRLGPPGDRSITVDGKRLFYETIDAGRFGGRAGDDARDTGGDSGLSIRDYSFHCHTEVVIRDGRMTAYNRTGNDCH